MQLTRLAWLGGLLCLAFGGAQGEWKNTPLILRIALKEAALL